MKGGKAPGLDQCAVEFLRKGEIWAWLRDSCDCSIVVLRQGEFQGTGVGHALPAL